MTGSSGKTAAGLTAFRRYAAGCPNRVPGGPVPRRPANALNVEVGRPADRCRLRTPPEWGNSDPRATRWLLSGGGPFVLGRCARAACPLKPAHCDACGHRGENHGQHGCCVNDNGWPCGCSESVGGVA